MHLERRGGELRGESRALDGHVVVGATGVRVERSDRLPVSLGMSGFGCSGQERAVSRGALASRGEHGASIDRGDLVEWYENTAHGVEQGVDVLHDPGCGDARLGVRLDLGAATPTVEADGARLRLTYAGHDDVAARLDALAVRDAEGRALVARFEVERGEAFVRFDARDAVYPVVVDPLLAVVQGALRPPYFVESTSGDEFGASVDRDGHYVVVGAPGRAVGGVSGAGAVYVFWRGQSQSWLRFVQRIDNPYPGAGDRFGHSVSVLGSRLVVGAPLGTASGVADGGAAYVYDAPASGVFALTQAITTPLPTTNDWFGAAVDQVSDTIFVGAPYRNAGATLDVGTVTVFQRNPSWTASQVLSAASAAADDNFGASLAADGTNLVVGIPGRSDPMMGIFGIGSVDMFARSVNSYSYARSLNLPSPGALDQFGYSVALCGNYLVVGTPGDDTGSTLNTGSATVYAFTGSAWNGVFLLQPPGLWANGALGAAVGCSGTNVWAGAPYADPSGMTDAGSVYGAARQTSGTWAAGNSPVYSGAHANARSGSSVGPSVIGSPGDQADSIPNAGTAYGLTDGLVSAAGGSSWGYFGSALAIDGNGLLGGTPYEDARYGDFRSGSAYFSTRSGSVWSTPVEVPPPSFSYDSEAGAAVAMDATMAVIGQPNLGGGAGAVNVYTRSGASAPVYASTIAGTTLTNETFGTTVALTADALYVGVPKAQRPQNPAYNAGVVRIYPRVGTTITTASPTVIEPDAAGALFPGFGALIAAQGNLLAVVVTDQVFLYERDSTSGAVMLSSTLAPSSPTTGFARVAFVGSDWLVVGAGTDLGFSRLNAYPLIQSLGHTVLDVANVQYLNPAAGDMELGRGLAARPGLVAASGSLGVSLFELSASGTTWVGPTALSSIGGPAILYPTTIALTDDTIAVASPSDDLTDAASGHYFPLMGQVHVMRLVRTDGTYCSVDGQCSNGHCVDGVCCNATCGGGNPNDCQACSVATGAAADGTCAPIAAGLSHVCRASSGACDVAETCNGSSNACPADALATNTVVCRPAADACDVAETCTGSAVTCPGDAIAAATTVCRPSAGICDLPESCDGVALACPSDRFAPANSVCRLAAGLCDLPDSCDGVSAGCTADLRAPNTIVCRAAADVCDVAETCDGTAVDCPSDVLADASVICRAAAGACDVAESCTGSAVACPTNAYAMDGTSCDDALVCTTSSSCLAGACSGSGAPNCDDGDPCTVDSCAEPSGCAHVASQAPSCLPDGGTDGGTSGDGGPDGGGSSASQGGCSCAVVDTSAERASTNAMAWMLALGVVVARRVRSSRSAGRSNRAG